VTGSGAAASLTVTNTGERTGSTVVQLYIGDTEASVSRPLRELKAFRKVRLEPGEARGVNFDLDLRSFAFFDVGAGLWRVEPGRFTIWAGFSADDLRCEAHLDLQAAEVER
jgi:beta-glucosidase